MADDPDIEKKVVRTPDELRRSLEQCEKRLRELKATRKSMAKDYNEQISDVEVEIGEILSQLEE